MKALKPARIACAMVAVLAFVCTLTFSLTGCSAPADGGTAATVNGTEIAEDDVTAYIQDFRETSGLDGDEAWIEWLDANSFTPETMRRDVIDFFVDKELLNLAAAERGVSVDGAAVDKSIEDAKAQYGGEETWQKALEVIGSTEEDYREQAERVELENALVESFDEGDPSDEEILEFASGFAGAKRSSCILFSPDNVDGAWDARSRIESGQIGFDEAVAEFSIDESAENGGDMGWDVLNPQMPEYAGALAELDRGQISEPVEAPEGFYLITCTDRFSVSEEGLTSIDQVPADILQVARENAVSSTRSIAYGEWLADFKAKAAIGINDMPENVPYNVDMAADEGGAPDGENPIGDEGADTEAVEPR